MEIKSLVNTSFDELFEAFQQAFAGYEVQLDKLEHVAMLNGVVLIPCFLSPSLMVTESFRSLAMESEISAEYRLLMTLVPKH